MGLASAAGLGEPGHGLEAPVGLDHREEDLARAAVVAAAIGELDTAEIEAAGLADGLEQRLTRDLAIDLAESGDHKSSDQISLERHEAGRGGRICGLEGSLIARNQGDRAVLR